MLIMWSYFTYYRGERKMERMDACSGPYERMCWPHVFFLGYFSLEWLSRRVNMEEGGESNGLW